MLRSCFVCRECGGHAASSAERGHILQKTATRYGPLHNRSPCTAPNMRVDISRYALMAWYRPVTDSSPSSRIPRGRLQIGCVEFEGERLSPDAPRELDPLLRARRERRRRRAAEERDE